MERKRIEKLVILLLVGILIPVSLFPFRINAETVLGNSPIIGVNIKYSEYNVDHEPYQLTASLEMPHRWQCTSSHSTMGCQVWSSQDTSGTIQDEITGYINVSNGSYTNVLYEYEFVLDKSYVGYIDFSTPISVTAYNRYFVNGTSFTLTSTQLITSFTVSRYNLEYAPLETINIMKQWNIPVESFNIVNYFLHTFELNDQGTYYYNYPLFNVPANTPFIVSRRLNRIGAESYLIIGINKNTWDLASFNNYVSQLENVEISNYERINIQDSPFNDQFGIVKLTIRNTSSVTGTLRTMSFNTDMVVLPIYNQEVSLKYISTDFALRYGLRNEILDNIQLIAQGTTQSSSSSGLLDQATSQFSDDANDLVTIEESFNNSMNQSLQSVNPTFNMGSSFLTSANWVSQQFNRIVNNTPFASLITFGLTLGLGLLIIGKVRK